jgi:glycosyltransferase involved in cell wall biosynthesis
LVISFLAGNKKWDGSIQMNTKPWLDIFLLCHNRPDGARLAIESILAQSAGGYRLIVSDNSSDDRVAKMVMAEYPDVTLLCRGCIPANTHFNLCISEASADYFCLFHDDDVMGPEFSSEMYKVVLRHPTAIAVGSNAWVIDQTKGTRGLSVLGFGKTQLVPTPEDLFRRYFGRHQTGFPPFPGYIYRTSAAGGFQIPNGGKYSDVSWLLTLADCAPLAWCHKPLMNYHLHGENDGMQESHRDRLRFFAFIKQHPKYSGRYGLADYRYFIYKKVVDYYRFNPHYFLRASLLMNYLGRQRICRHLRISEWPAFWRRLILMRYFRSAI